MAGPIQKAMSEVVNVASGMTVAGKKLYDDKRQTEEKISAEAEAQKEAEKNIQNEAQAVALEADLVRMGADPESAKNFMNAKELGLDTQGFGMIRRKGKFVGSYSSLADKLSKDALTDSLSSKVINEKGFAQRVYSLSGTRKGRVEALVGASKGGKK